MLDKQKIENAKHTVSTYLHDGLLKKQRPSAQIITTLRNNATESIQEASSVSSSLWRIVISYYAMFYAANAVLVSLGYKVGHNIAHKVTSDALIVYVRNRLRDDLLEHYTDMQERALATIQSDTIIASFEQERIKRGFFQYTTTERIKQAKAQTSLKRAQEFVAAMLELL